VAVPSTDAAIAAIAIHHELPLFTGDDHFADIARHSNLKLFV
jgi:predicted nucleic acid-binding protein